MTVGGGGVCWLLIGRTPTAVTLHDATALRTVLMSQRKQFSDLFPFLRAYLSGKYFSEVIALGLWMAVGTAWPWNIDLLTVSRIM